MANIEPMNTYEQTITNLSDSINDEVYCGLLDLDTDPGSAWEAVNGSNFNLIEDVEQYPATA